MNNKGDKGYSCRSPLELEKKPEASPLIKTEYLNVEMQKEIHFLHLSGKPIFLRMVNRKSQETLKAFSISSLHRTPALLDLREKSMHSLAIREASKIYRP